MVPLEDFHPGPVTCLSYHKKPPVSGTFKLGFHKGCFEGSRQPMFRKEGKIGMRPCSFLLLSIVVDGKPESIEDYGEFYFE